MQIVKREVQGCCIPKELKRPKQTPWPPPSSSPHGHNYSISPWPPPPSPHHQHHHLPMATAIISSPPPPPFPHRHNHGNSPWPQPQYLSMATTTIFSIPTPSSPHGHHHPFPMAITNPKTNPWGSPLITSPYLDTELLTNNATGEPNQPPGWNWFLLPPHSADPARVPTRDHPSG